MGISHLLFFVCSYSDTNKSVAKFKNKKFYAKMSESGTEALMLKPFILPRLS